MLRCWRWKWRRWTSISSINWVSVIKFDIRVAAIFTKQCTVWIGMVCSNMSVQHKHLRVIRFVHFDPVGYWEGETENWEDSTHKKQPQNLICLRDLPIISLFVPPCSQLSGTRRVREAELAIVLVTDSTIDNRDKYVRAKCAPVVWTVRPLNRKYSGTADVSSPLAHRWTKARSPAE